MSASPPAARGRPRHFDEREALDAAMELFWRQGFARTTLDHVVTVTGAARSSVYRTFGDKRTLFLLALDRYAERFERRVDDALGAHEDARAALEAMLRASADRLLDAGAPDGCLRCNATLELAGTDDEIDAALSRINRRYERAVQRVVDAGVARDQLDASAADGLALFVTGCVNGMVTLARAGAGTRELDAFVTRTLAAWPRIT